MTNPNIGRRVKPKYSVGVVVMEVDGCYQIRWDNGDLSWHLKHKVELSER